MYSELNILGAEKSLTIVEARPPITISGGIKRLAADKSKSIVFGISVPLPLFNRNQSVQNSLSAQIQSLEYEIDQARLESEASISSQIIQLKSIIDKHAVVDSSILPTAKKVYEMLQDSYEAGRVPYTQLLEAKRAYNELNFEHNDIVLNIRLGFMDIERLTGIAINLEKEK
jgi:cobalt-zinc-cadmium efflux system outer membrane protein